VGCEGALLGWRGLDVGRAEPAVGLRVLAEEVGALADATMMVAAVRRVALGMGVGVDVAREDEVAVAMKG
jgi:hypothetical protein